MFMISIGLLLSLLFRKKHKTGFVVQVEEDLLLFPLSHPKVAEATVLLLVKI